MTADLRSYPAPRERQASPELPDDPSVQLPRVRAFAFAFSIGAAHGRTTVSGPRCRGPAMLRDVSFYTTNHSGGALAGFEFGYATAPVSENNVALATPRPYVNLTELLDPFGITSTVPYKGMPDPSSPNTFTRFHEPLELLVEQLDFYPVIAFWNNFTVAAQLYHGTLRVEEQLDRNRLRFFPSAGQWPAPRPSRIPACASSICSRAPGRSSRCSSHRQRSSPRIAGTGSATGRRLTCSARRAGSQAHGATIKSPWSISRPISARLPTAPRPTTYSRSYSKPASRPACRSLSFSAT